MSTIALQVSQARTITIGPFIDPTDGTPQTGLTINATDVRLKKNGGAWAAASVGATHTENGNYDLALAAGDIDTVGDMEIHVQLAGSMWVRKTCQVLTAEAFLALYGPSAEGTNGTTVKTELEAIHLDHLLAVDYDPASPPGVATSWANELVQNNGSGVTQFTADALAQAPLGNNIDAATVKAQCDQALVDIHLDHFFAAAYTPQSKPGDAGAWANEMVEDAGGNVTRYTASALSQAPSGGGGGDWTTGERSQIRRALGVTGTTAATSGSGNLDQVLLDIAALNDVSTVEVRAQVDAGLSAIFLDQLFAQSYNSASPPGNAAAFLNELTQNNGAGVTQFTAVALELAPTGSGGSGDWSATEREQIRQALGVAGVKQSTDGLGVLDAVKTNTGVDIPASFAALNDVSVNDIWDELSSAHTTAGTFGAFIDIAISSRSSHNVSDVWSEPQAAYTTPNTFGNNLDAPISASGTDPAAVWAHGTRTLSAADNITSDGGVINTAAGAVTTVQTTNTMAGTIQTLDALDTAQDAQHAATQGLIGGLNDIAAGDVWSFVAAESYAADGAQPTAAQFNYMIWSALSEFQINSTTITSRRLDGSTTAMTFTMDSATTPTSRTRST